MMAAPPMAAIVRGIHSVKISTNITRNIIVEIIMVYWDWLSGMPSHQAGSKARPISTRDAIPTS